MRGRNNFLCNILGMSDFIYIAAFSQDPAFEALNYLAELRRHGPS